MIKRNGHFKVTCLYSNSKATNPTAGIHYFELPPERRDRVYGSPDAILQDLKQSQPRSSDQGNILRRHARRIVVSSSFGGLLSWRRGAPPPAAIDSNRNLASGVPRKACPSANIHGDNQLQVKEG
jgi:hypothetical protein